MITTSLDQLAQWGFADLQHVVAIDSSSDETSATIPSTEGQRRLSAALAAHFEQLGFSSERDDAANLLVRVPATKGREQAPPIALMVHMDTAHGTQPVERLHVVEKWDGGRVPYPQNPRLHVDADAYPLLRAFVGDDLVHGPGDFPFGLDDKLGMAELMTLGRLLAQEPIPHGELYLVFRPDEEIGRMEAVVGLAGVLAAKRVRLGFTVDGLAPFEVNVENFDAARARVRIPGARMHPRGRRAKLAITGVNTHGATAKSEGYLNATIVFARALRGLDDVVPVSFASDGLLECNAVVEVVGGDDAAIERARAALEREVAPARRRGADVRVLERGDARPGTDAASRLASLLRAFLDGPDAPAPLLSEDSDGRQGYTNPHRAVPEGDDLVVDFRIRDFTPDAVAARAKHVQDVASSVGLQAEVAQQYVNMGPVLAQFPDVPRIAEDAARDAGFVPVRQPIRGGTGVDPFLARGIPVANVGTGYFAPESEKELTSKQNIARHVAWLAHLVQRVG